MTEYFINLIEWLNNYYCKGIDGTALDDDELLQIGIDGVQMMSVAEREVEFTQRVAEIAPRLRTRWGVATFDTIKTHLIHVLPAQLQIVARASSTSRMLGE